MENVPLDRVFGVTGSRSINWLEWANRNKRFPPTSTD
jgi:hypothetical protein